LILATGSRHHYFGNDTWTAHAPGLKTIEDALDIRRRILTAFESAERESAERVRRALLTFVVVGGGPTGVELAGALSEIAAHAMTREFRSINPRSARVVLIEGSGTILPTYPEPLNREAERHLVELGVEVRTSCRVVGLDGSGVDTSRGRIESHTVLWAAGVAASPLGRHLGVPLDRAGRVLVQQDLSVPGSPEILVIGDLAAAIQPDGRPVPGVASAAAQAGRHAAKVVRADLQGRPRPVFHYRNKGSMATIGRKRAVADLGRAGRTSGLAAWVLWWLVHLMYLRGVRNRVAVWLGLVYQSATLRREARLITTTWVPPLPQRRHGDANRAQGPRPTHRQSSRVPRRSDYGSVSRWRSSEAALNPAAITGTAKTVPTNPNSAPPAAMPSRMTRGWSCNDRP
jgi:NADH dehydrogenase